MSRDADFQKEFNEVKRAQFRFLLITCGIATPFVLIWNKAPGLLYVVAALFGINILYILFHTIPKSMIVYKKHSKRKHP